MITKRSEEMEMRTILSNANLLIADIFEIFDDLDDSNDLKKELYAEIMILRQKIRDEIKPKLGGKGNVDV